MSLVPLRAWLALLLCTAACHTGAPGTKPSEDAGTDEDITPIESNEACGEVEDGELAERVRYQTASVPAGQTCVSERQQARCDDGMLGRWSGTFRHDACQVEDAVPGRACGTLADGETTTRERFAQAETPFGTACESETQTGTCDDGILTFDGTFTFERCEQAQPLACGVVAHGEQTERVRYRQAQVAYDDTCERVRELQTGRCDNGVLTWTGSASEEHCEVTPARACGDVAHGSEATRVRYTRAVAEQGERCSDFAETQTARCTDGTLSAFTGLAAFEACVPREPTTCAELAAGVNDTRLRFQAEEVAWNGTCASELQSASCVAGRLVWSGAFPALSCTPSTPRACGSTPHGQDAQRIRYREAEVAWNGSCDALREVQIARCTDGTLSAWSGSFTSEQCAPRTPRACGASPHGSQTTRTRYRVAEVAWDESCDWESEPQTGTCLDGTVTWTGSYTFTQCAARAPLACGSLPHDGVETRTMYQADAVAWNAQCVSETQRRRCSNGVLGAWSGQYRFGACRVSTPRDCGTIAHGSSTTRVRYRARDVAIGQSCEAETQTARCTDGDLAFDGRFAEVRCRVHQADEYADRCGGLVSPRLGERPCVLVPYRDQFQRRQRGQIAEEAGWTGSLAFVPRQIIADDSAVYAVFEGSPSYLAKLDAQTLTVLAQARIDTTNDTPLVSLDDGKLALTSRNLLTVADAADLRVRSFRNTRGSFDSATVLGSQVVASELDHGRCTLVRLSVGTSELTGYQTITDRFQDDAGLSLARFTQCSVTRHGDGLFVHARANGENAVFSYDVQSLDRPVLRARTPLDVPTFDTQRLAVTADYLTVRTNEGIRVVPRAQPTQAFFLPGASRDQHLVVGRTLYRSRGADVVDVFELQAGAARHTHSLLGGHETLTVSGSRLISADAFRFTGIDLSQTGRMLALEAVQDARGSCRADDESVLCAEPAARVVLYRRSGADYLPAGELPWEGGFYDDLGSMMSNQGATVLAQDDAWQVFDHASQTVRSLPRASDAGHIASLDGDTLLYYRGYSQGEERYGALHLDTRQEETVLSAPFTGSLVLRGGRLYMRDTMNDALRVYPVGLRPAAPVASLAADLPGWSPSPSFLRFLDEDTLLVAAAEAYLLVDTRNPAPPRVRRTLPVAPSSFRNVSGGADLLMVGEGQNVARLYDLRGEQPRYLPLVEVTQALVAGGLHMTRDGQLRLMLDGRGLFVSRELVDPAR